MGQAFDRSGNLLGEATGDTKREVLDKLEGRFKDAHEIRITSAMGTDAVPQRNALAIGADVVERVITESGERMLPWFRFAHLPPTLQTVSAGFAWLAVKVVEEVPAGAERTVALRKLLEGKDAAVRAALPA